MADDRGCVAAARRAALGPRAGGGGVARPRRHDVRLRLRRDLAPLQVHGGVVLDGHVGGGGGNEIPPGRVVVDAAGTIAAVGPAADVALPAGAQVVAAPWV